jgi:CheY-like chemotaxis protein
MNKCILIIEDDFETQFLFSELLTAEGYDVITQSSGVDALAYLTTATRSPDLIFMDLNFPGGTPEEFVRKLREVPATSKTPIVLVSGKADIQEYAERLKARYIKKPFDLDPVLNIIKELT